MHSPRQFVSSLCIHAILVFKIQSWDFNQPWRHKPKETHGSFLFDQNIRNKLVRVIIRNTRKVKKEQLVISEHFVLNS